MIRIKNLGKSVKGKDIIRNVNLSFNDKGLYLLKGDNGAGKSTLLSIIGLIDNNYTGLLEIDGCNFKSDFLGFRRTAYRRRNISFLMPKNNLIEEETAEANLDYFSDKKYSWPFKDIDLTEKAGQLSGGEQQLIGLVREIKSDRRIMLLDEITSFLDDKKTRWILDQLEKISEDKLVIFATHDQRVSFPSARTIFLDKGIIND